MPKKVANVLVHIEADGNQPTEASLRVLGEGRRIATSLGATLYAHVQIGGDGSAEELGAIAGALGRAGADRAIVSRGPDTSAPAMWSTHGPALCQACADVRPLLVLLAGGATGAELGPRLAANAGAAFLSEPEVERGPNAELVFSRAVYGSTFRRRLSVEELEQTVVVTLPAHRHEPAGGAVDADVRIADRQPSLTGVDYAGATPDPGAILDRARVLVVAGAGVASFETFAQVETLAAVLGGTVAATRALCAKGIAPPEREIGIGARLVAPELLVVCGASGSSANLGAVFGDPDIIAIDSDPDAAIFGVADYGLVGDLDVVLPELIRALRTRPREAAAT